MRTWLVVIVMLIIATATFASPAAKQAIVWPAKDIKWTDNPAIKGARTAVLWGDPKKGAYGALKFLPAGSSLALHTHTNDERVVAISGTIALSIDLAPARDIPPGSYVLLPGGLRHSAHCKAGADCIYFSEQSGISDINFVK